MLKKLPKKLKKKKLRGSCTTRVLFSFDERVCACEQNMGMYKQDMQVTLLGYELIMRTSVGSWVLRTTSSSMLLRTPTNAVPFVSLLQIRSKNLTTLRSSFCEMRLHVA